MNRIDQLFQTKGRNILSVYFTAGYPALESMPVILPALEAAGVDLVEIGMPFSDPLADGAVIQASSQQALENGMSLKLLFKQLKEVDVSIPLILMGYLNPVLQYGLEAFLKSCHECGVSGLILPDLPVEEYLENRSLFNSYGQHNILLITPLTSDERIQYLADLSQGFVYIVATSATTGTRSFKEIDPAYFERLNQLIPDKPKMIGFGIRDHEDFIRASKYANGAIIGSHFVKMLAFSERMNPESINKTIVHFVSSLQPN